MKVRISFLEGLLGTASANPEIHREFIASKAPDAKSIEDEVAAIGVDAVVEKSQTVFPRLPDGAPFLWDYQIKGFLKDAAGMLCRAKGTESGKMSAYKKIVDGLVFVKPRQIAIHMPDGSGIKICERPLRAETAQGPRIALAASEEVPAGSWIELEIESYEVAPGKKDAADGLGAKFNLQTCITEWLDYGAFRGIGQWRNSGKGRFEWKAIG